MTRVTKLDYVSARELAKVSQNKQEQAYRLAILYYFTGPNALVVDPFGGSGTTPDVCRHMERRCLTYALQPSRDDIIKHDISHGGFPKEAQGCDLIFLDPP